MNLPLKLGFFFQIRNFRKFSGRRSGEPKTQEERTISFEACVLKDILQNTALKTLFPERMRLHFFPHCLNYSSWIINFREIVMANLRFISSVHLFCTFLYEPFMTFSPNYFVKVRHAILGQCNIYRRRVL